MYIDDVKSFLIRMSSVSVIMAMLMLFIFLMSISIRTLFLIPLAGVTVFGYLLLTIPYWWLKGNARSGVFILLACALVLIWRWHLPDVRTVLVRFTDVFWLLLAMGLLRHVMNTWRISEFLSERLMRYGKGSLTLSIAILTAFLAWPMSLGVIPLMIDALKKSVFPSRHLAAIVMRMMSITMVLMPTSIGAATVFAAMPRTPIFTSAALGIPLFLFSLLLLCLSPVIPLANPIICDERRANKEGERVRIWIFLIFFWLIFIVALTVIRLNALESIALTASILYLIERGSSRSIDFLTPLVAVIRSISSEIMLLLGCSLLISTCDLLIPLLPVTFSHSLASLSVWQRYACILFVLPIFSVVGIHPMVLFSLAFPLLGSSMAYGVTDYLVWICFFIAAQLLSPVSINAIFASSSLHISPVDTSFKMHSYYVLIFNLFAFIYLSFFIQYL